MERKIGEIVSDVVRCTTVHKPRGRGLGRVSSEGLRGGGGSTRGARGVRKNNGRVKLFEDLALRDNMALLAAPLAFAKVGLVRAWEGRTRG